MISDYIGTFEFNALSIQRNAPMLMGVYYCSFKRGNRLIVTYVGRGEGEYVNIRSRLLDHLRYQNWINVTHFGYKLCTTKKEATELEAAEIHRLQPENNIIGKK